jgi:hypothetical protein
MVVGFIDYIPCVVSVTVGSVKCCIDPDLPPIDPELLLIRIKITGVAIINIKRKVFS